MVLERIKAAFAGKSDRELRGLEGFTGAEQERILNRIAAKETELRRTKADRIVQSRVERLEKGMGLGPKQAKGKSSLQSIKDFRQGNLRRQAERSKIFQENERLFREGRLPVKPVGQPNAGPQITTKLDVKPINLKAPPSGIK